MWLFVLFDLPMTTKREKKEYVRYRGALLSRGFSMLQWSVYARAYPNEAASRVYSNELVELVPSRGRVRLLVVTDLQFSRMIVCDGAAVLEPEKPLKQLMIFDN